MLLITYCRLESGALGICCKGPSINYGMGYQAIIGPHLVWSKVLDLWGGITGLAELITGHLE